MSKSATSNISENDENSWTETKEEKENIYENKGGVFISLVASGKSVVSFCYSS